MRMLLLSIAIAFSGAAMAQAYQPGFDASKYKGPASGPANEVLVLGSPHLKQVSAAFRPAALSLLEQRLAGWRPQSIAIEALSGPQCDFLRRYPRRYPDTFNEYCGDTAAARAATGFDVPAATDEAEKLLASWPAAPSPAQRRRLAAVFLAGGERASALVQWLRLPAAERRAGDGLEAALVDTLGKLEGERNERYLIGARLAARLGLERVHAMDDHTADWPADDDKAYGAALAKAWDNPTIRQAIDADRALEEGMVTAQGVLAVYRAANAPGAARIMYEGDFGAALNEPSPQRYGRQYLGYWETRNLRMAANIRDVLGMHPGIRMLVIVGASHKGYLESYLHQMHDVRIVDAMPLLK